MASQSRKQALAENRKKRWAPVGDRLVSRLARTATGCDVYMGHRLLSGYGVITDQGKQILTHRLAYELANGPIPNGILVCHHCDNPPCCNPRHLFLGTIADNNRDMWAKGRGKLTPPAWRKIPLDEVPNVVSMFKLGETKNDIAEAYGVTRQAIHYLLRREGVI